MASEKYIFTRREFLKGMGIAGVSLTLPAFLTRAVNAAENIPGSVGRGNDNILVVCQLGGGNDGLNTVIPYGNDEYYRKRSRLALKKSEVLRLDDVLGLHPNMTGLHRLYEDGRLGIVNGVGYPNPDRSHFRSMEIWHTAVDSDKFESAGWIGRYFDNCCGGKSDPVDGVNIGSEVPQAFAGRSGAGVSFQMPEQFRWNEGRIGSTRRSFEEINKISEAHGDKTSLDFLRHTTANIIISSDSVIKAGQVKRSKPEYPQSRLARSFQTIADLIAGGLPTRIYYASMSGFDTHAGQLGQHANLLGQFSGAVSAFYNDLKAIGVSRRVVIICFSEFGRRFEENGSSGTDHGTAGPVFVIGDRLKPGLHSMYPDLTDLDGNDDLKHTIDFRSLYAELLDDWLNTDHTSVLNRGFSKIGIIG